MKTKIKRHYRSVLSVVLAVCMLVSCMTVGLIASDAAKVTGDEAAKVTGDEELGATEYLILRYNNNDITSEAKYVSSSSKTFTIKASDFGQTSFETGINYYIGYSTSNSYTGIDKGSTDVTIGTKDSGISGFFPQNYSVYKFAGFSLANSNIKTVTVTVSGSAPYTYSLTSSTTDSGGSSGGDSGTEIDDDLVSVLKGTKIMFYYGDKWGTGTKYLKNTQATTITSGVSEELTISNNKYYVTTACVASASYNVSNDSGWSGQSIGTPSAGNLHYIYSESYGKNKADSLSSTVSVSWSKSTDTITEGTASSAIAATVSGKSGKSGKTGANRDVTVKYFYTTDDTNFYEFDPSSTGSLSAGTYTIYAAAYDTKIYVAAASQATLTVNSAETKHAVTFTSNPVEGGSITPATGTEVGETTPTTITATPNAGYQFNGWTFGDGITGESTSNASTTITTKSSGTYSVTASFTKKDLNVRVTQPASGGTISSNKSTAQVGDTVTITAVPATGYSLSAISYSSIAGSGTASGTGNTRTFTMPGADTEVTATFNADSGTSNFYYNSYGSNGEPASTHYGARMTEATINGETYSYYHVTGRMESDQLFTVSYGSPKYNSYNTYFQYPEGWGGTPEVQFYTTDGKNLGAFTKMTDDGKENGKLKWKYSIPDGAREVQFKHGTNYSGKLSFASGNNAWWVENSMTNLHGWNSSNPVPTNFDEYFYDVNKYTNAFNTDGFYGHNVSRGESHAYTKPKGLDSTTKTNYYVLVLYQNKTYTINGVTRTITNNPEIIWLPTLPSAVPDNTETVDIYAKNGTLRDSNYNRFTNLANTDIDTDYFEYSEILESGVYTYTSIVDYNEKHSSKPITITNNVSGYDSTYATMTNVPVGAKIKLRTTLSSDSTAAGSFDSKAFKDTHYLKAYSFNGMTYEVHSANDTGVYEEVWTVRDVNTKSVSGSTVTNLTKNGKTIEVTPIYYMQDNSNCKTFYIDGYDGTVQNAWGNMLCVYPYYEGKPNSANAFGGYPGQPMLFWGGKYQMEIPLTVDGTASGASVKGLTLHNAYWDLLHKSLDIRCNTRGHAQTYDYDDFYKLYKEKNPDTIIFDFKYRTKEDHYGDGYEYTNYTFAGSDAKAASEYVGDNKNGVELVTDYFGRQVDAFGTLITDSDLSDYGTTGTQDKELLFVSTGYKDTYVGEYATLWAVYAPQSSIPSDSNDTPGKFIGYISSSMLYLNNWDRRLQYTGGDSTANGRMSWSAFETTYSHLKTYYTGVPALISYEKEIWNESKGKANRSDGKWYYSNKSDKIEASIKIQYGSHTLLDAPDHSVSSSAWHDDDFDDSAVGINGGKNIGTITRCSAYFTNTSPNLLGKVASGEQFADSTKKFTFEAVPSGAYMFAGWVRYSNGKYYEITENEIGESPMSANDVYIARFVDAQTGTLTVQHVVEQTSTHTGTGTPAVTVTVKNGSGDIVETFTNSTVGEKLDISKYIDSHFKTYTIDISLTTTPTNESYMKEILSSSSNFAASPSSWDGTSQTSATDATVAQFTVQDVLNSGVTSLRYVSHLQKPTYTYQYQITYYYNSRFWGQQSYTVTGAFADDNDFAANTTGSKTTAKLNTDFIINKTPYEKNFRQEINWNYAAMTNNPATLVAGSANTYKMTASVSATNTVNDEVSAEFVLPYYYNGKDQDYSAHVADVYNSQDDPHDENGHSNTTYLYDTSHESVTLTTRAYKLFTADGEIRGGGDDIKASSLHLIEAAPYLMMDDSNNPISYHYMLTDNMRYYTGKSFKVGDTTYYLSQEDVPENPGTYKVLTASDSVNFTKIKYAGTDQTTTYHFAVEDTSEGQKGEYGYKVYFFSYEADEFGNYLDNNGNPSDTPVFNGQYCVYSVGRDIDGIIAGTGVKKYFTRWDIYNTKGDFVASCYNRRFNYSGYDNYVVRPIYESDTERNYATSLGTGVGSSITYLDDSRNQWNDDSGESGSGNYASVTNQTDLADADKLFTDFAISYSYYGKNINTVSNLTTDPTNGANIKVGMIIERLDELDKSGGKYITSASHYADKYKSDEGWQNLAGRLDGSTSGTLTSAVTSGHKCYNSKIGANYTVDGYTPFGTAAPGANSSQTSVLDNFNRLQWFYTINNFGTASEMKNYAYRAISYMVVEDSTGTHAYLCDAPTYFTIYDTATRVGY